MKDGGKASLRGEIESLAKDMGSTCFGIADLAPARQRISEQGGEFLTQFPRAVSHGFVLADGIVNTLVHHKNVAALHSYWYYVYQIVNPRIDSISLMLAQSLGEAGFQAFVVPSSQLVDRPRLTGVFSHKLAAHLAGLGWIGKSCLLVTPQVGPRVRWSTVLTDASLEATGRPMEERCGACQQCVEICPVQAFTGRPFRAHEPRESRFDAGRCDRYFAEMEAKDPETTVCGLCLYVCPYGRRQR